MDYYKMLFNIGILVFLCFCGLAASQQQQQQSTTGKFFVKLNPEKI